MSDVEHELLIDVSETRDLALRVGAVALRTLEALRDAQGVAGEPEPWIDAAIADVAADLATPGATIQRRLSADRPSASAHTCARTRYRHTQPDEEARVADDEIEINGGIVVYEWVGPDDGDVCVITPGGRFSKDFGGIHELAYALADGGKRVLLWDRPNCGRSDVQLYGQSESHMRAETLGLMFQAFGIDQVVAIGGSGGARDSIVFTLM